MTSKEYADYEEAVADFFEREGVCFLSPEEGDGFFTWSQCECCRRMMGGIRLTCRGDNGFLYDVCEDCVYYNAYGVLDDVTMETMKECSSK